MLYRINLGIHENATNAYLTAFCGILYERLLINVIPLNAHNHNDLIA